MTDPFDPYYKWLGIPTKDQPANHYRLLGIEKFERDADVISLAADQRMSFLRTFQTGEHSDLSQQLLNEVSAAKLCLLNSKQKGRYDATLRTEEHAEAGDGSPGLEVTTAWSPQELSVNEKSENMPQFNTDKSKPVEKADRQKIRKRSIILIALGLAATVLLLLIAAEEGDEQPGKESKPLAKRDESVQGPDSGSPGATFDIGDLRNNPEQQASLEDEATKARATRKAKEEAERNAKEEAERKANEEAERKANEEAQRKAREEQARLQKEAEARRAQEEADRKERRRAMLKERAEARRTAEALRRTREEESRKKAETWRKDNPDEYLEGLGLVKKGNFWQLKDATVLKEQTDDLTKQRATLKRDLDGTKEIERKMPGRYKKLEQMLKVNLAKLKKTRPGDSGEGQQLGTWILFLSHPDFREALINDSFPSREDLPPGWQWYADKGPQTRDRLIEFLNQRGSSFERAQQQYLQSIQQLKARKKNLDERLDGLLNEAREVYRFKNDLEAQWKNLQSEMENVTEAIGSTEGQTPSASAPIKPIKTTIEKAEDRVEAVLELKEDIDNFLKPAPQEQRGPPPGAPRGNRPR